MNRELNMVIIADVNNVESRQLIAELAENPAIRQTIITPQLARNVFPIRATPAVGICLWSNDLQGFSADVEAFAAYIKGESDVKTAAYSAQRFLPDEEALKQPRVLIRTWEEVLSAGAALETGDKILLGEQLYNVEQPNIPLEHYPPDGDGMLAIYRPINPAHAGTLEDPIPWVYGMDCEAGKHYLYEDAVYRVTDGGDMKPCTWTPDSGIWQWEKVE